MNIDENRPQMSSNKRAKVLSGFQMDLAVPSSPQMRAQEQQTLDWLDLQLHDALLVSVQVDDMAFVSALDDVAHAELHYATTNAKSPLEHHERRLTIAALDTHHGGHYEDGVAADDDDLMLLEEELGVIQDDGSRFPYRYCWSVATQKGYRYPPNGQQNDSHQPIKKLDIHAEMEDQHFPFMDNSPNFVHAITQEPFQVFMLADGHGGHECAQFAVNTIPPRVVDLINSRQWNLGLSDHQETLRAEIERIFLDVDTVYCEHKLNQYRALNEKAKSLDIQPYDTRLRAEKPADDGCTLVLNVFYDNYLINCNVGDSRTLLLSRPTTNTILQHQKILDDTHSIATTDHRIPTGWTPVFASTDHTPGLLKKALQIHTNGGRFIMNGATVYVKSMLEKSMESNQRHIEFLSQCRIGRPLGWRIEEVNFPACTTLNLSGTLGDLFFKYDPPLLNARPDVEFVKLDMEKYRYLAVMASDGLWDHMAHSDPEIQNGMMSRYVDAVMDHADVDYFNFVMGAGSDATSETLSTPPSERSDSLHSPTSRHPSTSSLNHTDDDDDDEISSSDEVEERLSPDLMNKLQKLGILAHGLADREKQGPSQLYARPFFRYDDITVFVVLVEGVVQNSEVVNRDEGDGDADGMMEDEGIKSESGDSDLMTTSSVTSEDEE